MDWSRLGMRGLLTSSGDGIWLKSLIVALYLQDCQQWVLSQVSVFGTFRKNLAIESVNTSGKH